MAWEVLESEYLYKKPWLNAGACTNYSHTYLAVGVEKVSSQHLEESEDIKIVLLDREEVLRMLKNDEFHQAMMAAPLW